jgi:hypothetical protein
MKLPIIRRHPIIAIVTLSFISFSLVAWSPPNSEDIITNRSNINLRDTNSTANTFGTGNSNIVGGIDITMGNANQGSWRSLSMGQSSTTLGLNNLSIGSNNLVRGSTANTPAYNSAAFGLDNLVTATYGWAVGSNNESSGTRSVSIGTGSRANVTSGTALGKFNSSMASTDVVAIGSGSDSNNRFTALRVTSDGGVILGRAQGDISMGAYAN